MAKVDIERYVLSFNDTYFFDTNVWLLLYGAIGDFQKNDQRRYSNFFGEVLQKDKPIYITSLVLSEISNVLLRRDFKQWVESKKLYGKDFKKDFVGTAFYEDAVKSISAIINKILALPNVIRVSDSFHSLNISNILNDFAKMDFNDSFYTQLCLTNNYKLVTNDKDLILVSDKIDVLTTQ